MITKQVELSRKRLQKQQAHSHKAGLGQFLTPMPLARFMASLFTNMKSEVRLLDPGVGLGSLTAAFVEEALKRGNLKGLHIEAYDIDTSLSQATKSNLALCTQRLNNAGITAKAEFQCCDFIEEFAQKVSAPLFSRAERFTHIIMNPPYKKIGQKSKHRKALALAGLETVNLYTGFLSLGLRLLEPGGELVAIVPRSFCNGPYYKSFRKFLLQTAAIQRIHIFDSRTDAFSDDGVLQENIILHLIKGAPQQAVCISSSPNASFHETIQNSSPPHETYFEQQLPFEWVVPSDNEERFIYVMPKPSDLEVVRQMNKFKHHLSDLNIEVSTGPVVSFRHKEDLCTEWEAGCAPLLYTTHLNGKVEWPKSGKKPNAIRITENSERWLWQNEGHFVITRRFSSKEEKRRIYASLCDEALEQEYIGFDNQLNVFHRNKKGISSEEAVGLWAYLNSSLVDAFFRLFSGHTQVNATDLRNMPFPSKAQLLHLAQQVSSTATQATIDSVLEKMNSCPKSS